MLAGRQHGDHAFCALGGGFAGIRRAGTFGHQGLNCWLGQIEHGNVVAGFEQVGRHRRTHVAQADKGNLGHVASPCCCTGHRCAKQTTG